MWRDKGPFCLALANAVTSPMTTFKKNMPKVIGSLIGSLLSVLDEVTFPHGMMSLGWDVTSDSIRLGRLVDGKVMSSN